MAKDDQADSRPNSDKQTEEWLKQHDPEYGKTGPKRKRDSRKEALTKLAGARPRPEDFPDTLEGTKAFAAAVKAHTKASLDLSLREKGISSEASNRARLRQRIAERRGQTVRGNETVWNLGISAEVDPELATAPLSRAEVRAAAKERREYRVRTGDLSGSPKPNSTISRPKPSNPKPSRGSDEWSGTAAARGTVTTSEATKAKVKATTIKVADPSAPTTTEDYARLEDIARRQRELENPVKSAVKRQQAVSGEDLDALPANPVSERDRELVATVKMKEAARVNKGRVRLGDPAQNVNVHPVSQDTVTDPVTGAESVQYSAPYVEALRPEDTVIERDVRYPGEVSASERQLNVVTPTADTTLVGPAFTRSESERRGQGRGRRLRGLSTQEAAKVATIEEGTHKVIDETMSEMPFGQHRRSGSIRIQGPGATALEEGSVNDYTELAPAPREGVAPAGWEGNEDVPAGPLAPSGTSLPPRIRRRTDITTPSPIKQGDGRPNLYPSPLKAGAPQLHLRSAGPDTNISVDQFESAWNAQSRAAAEADAAKAADLSARSAGISRQGRRRYGIDRARSKAIMTPGTRLYAEEAARARALKGVRLPEGPAVQPSSTWGTGEGMIGSGPMINTPKTPTRELTVDTAVNDQEREIVSKVQEAKAKGSSPEMPVTLGMDLAGDVRSVPRQRAAASADRDAALSSLQRRHAAGDFATGEASPGVVPASIQKEMAWESLRQRQRSGSFGAGASEHHAQ